MLNLEDHQPQVNSSEEGKELFEVIAEERRRMWQPSDPPPSGPLGCCY